MCGCRKYPYPPQRVTKILRGRVSERGKFSKGRGATCTQRVFFLVGVKMRLNEHYCTFPIDSGNQTDKSVPSVEINVRFFVI